MSHSTSLRDQQAEFTKRLLMEAARKVIIENEPDDFTMQKVAEEAGVSHRTVYRYFPSRQALIDEFSNYLESQFGTGNMGPENIEQVDHITRTVFSVFDRNAHFYIAAARLNGGILRPANQAERTARMRRVFDEAFPDLDPWVADKSFAVLRYLIGLQTWYTMRDRFQMEDGEAGDAIGWAARELVRAISEGRHPVRTSHKQGKNENETT